MTASSVDTKPVDTAREGALASARAANKAKAHDITVQHIKDIAPFADYLVCVSVSNSRQEHAVLDEIEGSVHAGIGQKPFHREDGAGWSLLDYGTFTVNVFSDEARDFYRLEELWGDAPALDLSALGFEDLEYTDRIENFMRPRRA